MISIIIPVYNTEKYLHRCLDSIIVQTYKDWECILVDDGSEDYSPSICDEYVQKDSRFKVIHKTNAGVSTARNRGLDQATGEWIYFCDSDDCLYDGHALAKLLKLTENADLAVGTHVVLDDNGKGITESVEPISTYSGCLDKKEYISELIKPKLHIDYIGFLWNKLFKLDIIKKNNLSFAPDIKYAEDLLFITQYVCSPECHKIALDNNIKIYKYYQHTGSVMSNIRKHYNPAFFTDFIAYERILDIIHNCYHNKVLDIASQHLLCVQGLWHLDMMEHSQYTNLSQREYIKNKIQDLREYKRSLITYSLRKIKEYALTLSMDERIIVINKYLHSKECQYKYLNFKWKLAWLLSHFAGKRGLNLIKNKMNFNS